MRKHLSCVPVAVNRYCSSKTMGLGAVIGGGESHKMITGGEQEPVEEANKSVYSGGR